MSKPQINRGGVKYYKHLTRLSSFVLFIFAYAIVITGSTYAFVSFSAMSDSVANGQGGCFEVNYSAQEINASNLSSTTNYWEGASSSITLSKATSCKIYTEANIYVNTNQSSTAPIDTVPALRYKLFMESNQISEGLITQKGDTLIATVPLTDSIVNYTLYVWIDSSLSGGNYDNTSYSGQIFAESSQTSTVDNNYLLTFNDNNDLNINLNKTVTIGENYGWLPKLEKKGYTFKGWSELPADYQQLEYIEATGTQYILTDVIPTSDFKIVADVYQFSSYTSETAFAGVSDSSTNKCLEYYFVGGRPKFWLNNGSQALSIFGSSNSVYNQIIHYEASLKSTGINLKTNVGEESNSIIYTGNSNITPLMLFAYNSKGNPAYLFRGRIYNLKIYDSDNIISDFIPCYKISAGKAGMYDKVNNKFYPNSASSGNDFVRGSVIGVTDTTTITQNKNHTLTAMWETNTYIVSLNANGGSVSPTTMSFKYGDKYSNLPTPTKSGYTFKGWSELPADYQQLEYIEATGTQYILTDIIPSSNFRLSADVYQSSSYTNETAFAGVRDSATNKGLEYYFVGGVPKFWLYNGSSAATVGNTSGTYYDQVLHYDASIKPTGNTLKTSVTGNFSSSTIYSGISNVTPLMFFAYNSKGSPAYLFRGRVYNIKIYSSDNLTSDFIPCYKISAGKAGMYDKVNNKFYPNSASSGNDFVRGSVIGVTDTTTITQDKNHTLTAMWE